LRFVFVDSSFYIAFVHTRDMDHARAVRLILDLDATNTHYVTSPAVILEVLAYFSRLGPRLRERAALLAERLIESTVMEIVALDDGIFRAALDLYRRRLDKRYSLADCLAMVICRDRAISDVLTTDRDFEAEGFTILLDG
jgi:predicted nucleic acid-binding protein